jgi:hypothetical protein
VSWREGRGSANEQFRQMNNSDFPQPIFVLAPPRSFTSVFGGVLGQHPELLGSSEFDLFRAATVGEFIELRWPRQHAGIYRFIAQLYAGEQTIDAIEMAKRWLRVRQDRTTAEVHRELCASVAPRALVQKSPMYMRRLSYLERVLEAFPEARFIHLLRHPTGLSESALKFKDAPVRILALGGVDRTGKEPVLDPQILWHDFHLRILRFQEKVPPEQWLRVRGEEFLADLDNQLPRIAEWLGISTAPEAIAAMKRPEESPFACFGPANAVLGNDPNFLHAPKLRPYKPREESLEGPLPWRQDGASYHPRVVEMARSFGYT